MGAAQEWIVLGIVLGPVGRLLTSPSSGRRPGRGSSGTSSSSRSSSSSASSRVTRSRACDGERGPIPSAPAPQASHFHTAISPAHIRVRELFCMDVNRNEESRRSGLAFSLGLIDDYERDQLRVRDRNPVRPRTPEEIRRECDAYRCRAYGVWAFPCPLPAREPDEPQKPPAPPTSAWRFPVEAGPAPTSCPHAGHGPGGEGED